MTLFPSKCVLVLIINKKGVSKQAKIAVISID